MLYLHLYFCIYGFSTVAAAFSVAADVDFVAAAAAAVIVIIGKPVFDESGELVCTKPFPSMPTAFLNDPDGSKYDKAYFLRFPGKCM